jgi:hypothetical protein
MSGKECCSVHKHPNVCDPNHESFARRRGTNTLQNPYFLYIRYFAIGGNAAISESLAKVCNKCVLKEINVLCIFKEAV